MKIILYIFILIIIYGVQPSQGIADTHIFLTVDELKNFLTSYTFNDWLNYRYVFYLDLVGMILYTSYLFDKTKSKVALITYLADLIESFSLFLFSFNISLFYVVYIASLIKWVSIIFLLIIWIKNKKHLY